MTDCNRKDKWFRGCKFEPRFDSSPADLTQFGHIDRMPVSALKMFQKREYVRDVCVTCGKVIERAAE